MPLILRGTKGTKLTTLEMDGNLIYLSSTLSGSIIQVTGSSIDASNTSITASFFVGDGSGLTNITSSYVVTSSYAATSSYSTTLIANVSNPSAGELRFRNSANTTIASITDLTASLSANAISSSYASTASYSTTLGANLHNAFESGNLRLLNSAGNTIVSIDKFYSYKTIGVVTSSIDFTSSAGFEGQVYAVEDGSNYYLYVYIGGQWRSSSLA